MTAHDLQAKSNHGSSKRACTGKLRSFEQQTREAGRYFLRASRAAACISQALYSNPLVCSRLRAEAKAVEQLADFGMLKVCRERLREAEICRSVLLRSKSRLQAEAEQSALALIAALQCAGGRIRPIMSSSRPSGGPFGRRR